MILKQARNWVCLEYADAIAQAGKNVLVEKKLRERLVIEAKLKFEINGKFDVPRTTILSRIKADKLEVFNTGVSSPVLEMEPFLVATVISAWECGYPLSVGECILVANNLIESMFLPKR